MPITLESLPVELVTAILEELDLASLIVVSYLSRRLHTIASDRSLNPWRAPILRNLHSGVYEDSLKHLSVRTTVPRQNWIEILSMAQPRFLLFESTLSNMKEADWRECFKRRFLPGWEKWKKGDLSWHEAFMKCVDVDVLECQSHSYIESLGCCSGSGTAV
jgi:F-box domain